MVDAYQRQGIAAKGGWTVKILVTGGHGQLGKELVKELSKEHEAYGFSKQDLDVTDIQQASAVLRRIRPDAVVHAAAYTKVDQAELDPDSAYSINAYGTRNMAVAAQQMGAKMVYISTDYVFDGSQSAPYRELDQTSPLNIYGKSKLAGEQMVQTFTEKFFIVRTSWLYGKHGHNFVSTMLQLSQTNDELQVVCDQVGTPTYTLDLSRFISGLIKSENYGIYHASNTGSCSWFEFAQAVFQIAAIPQKIVPVESKDFSQLAVRPAYSVLDHMAIRLHGFEDFRHWRDALQEFLTASS
jgi:dTDP-4-dehydrorhamnose reductase